jgi:hypothetical protein
MCSDLPVSSKERAFFHLLDMKTIFTILIKDKTKKIITITNKRKKVKIISTE